MTGMTTWEPLTALQLAATVPNVGGEVPWGGQQSVVAMLLADHLQGTGTGLCQRAVLYATCSCV